MKFMCVKNTDMLNSMEGNEESVRILGEYLGYKVGRNPVDPTGEWKIYFSSKTESTSVGVIAAKPQEDLTNESSTLFVRRLYQQQVLELKNHLGTFSVSVVAFVGVKRIVFFQMFGGNRDRRLDINLETIGKELYAGNLNYLKDEHVKLIEDEFGFGEFEIKMDFERIFRQELTNHFLEVVSLYRKKLSELITGAHSLRMQLKPAVDQKTIIYIERDDLPNLVQSDSYLAVLSTVVDTIILRQLMRRFLEGYYGADSFEVSGIALGVGNGTMDDAIREVVHATANIGNEQEIRKLNVHRSEIHQLSLFADVLNDDELKSTSQVSIEKDKRDAVAKLSRRAQKQFELTYDGDLFAGRISEITNSVEEKISEEFPEFMAKMWIDTSANNYSFRYEDMPPESLEKQYERSMSNNVQIEIDRDTRKPLVYYGKDASEQKSKGAYYTDINFVNYMIEKSVIVEFDKRCDKVRETVKNGTVDDVDSALAHLLDLKIADFTVGGGSFLRGAFIKLSEKYESFADFNIPSELFDRYPMFSGNSDSQYLWEKYVLENMLYGVDIDYKALIIASLTLTLSSLENRPKETKLPQLIGRTLINQNSLINAVPYYRREEVFGRHQKDIARLVKLKKSDFDKFDELRKELQGEVISELGSLKLGKLDSEDFTRCAKVLKIEAIELNLPEIFFNEDGTLKEHGGVDIVVGNPPWEVWKPNSDEFFGPLYGMKKFNALKKKEKKKVQDDLLGESPTLREKWEEYNRRMVLGSDYFRNDDCFRYQAWVVDGKKVKSDINLYKISLERFVQLGNDGCRYSILVPDNLVTDLGNTGLRHMLFDNYNVEEFLSFDNNKGIFPGVHRSYKFAVLNFNGDERGTRKLHAFFYKQSLDLLNNDADKLEYDMEDVRRNEPQRLSLCEFRSRDESILYNRINNRYRSLEESKLIDFTRDFDKTNDSKMFVKNNGGNDLIPLYEGKFINQFRLIRQPSELEEAVARDVVAGKVGEDYRHYRIVVRSIGRATDERSLIATLLPPLTTAANSLMMQKGSDRMELSDKLFYLGMLDSYCLDYVLRRRITSNVNKFLLMSVPMPKPVEVADAGEIVGVVKALLKENGEIYAGLDDEIPGNKYDGFSHEELIAELNARIMIDFGLSRDDIVNLMKSFESAKHTEDVRETAQNIIDVYDKMKEQCYEG